MEISYPAENTGYSALEKFQRGAAERFFSQISCHRVRFDAAVTVFDTFDSRPLCYRLTAGTEEKCDRVKVDETTRALATGVYSGVESVRFLIGPKRWLT